MTTPDPAAIEAGARAAYESYRAKWQELPTVPWEQAGPNTRASQIRQAEIHYAAMEPHIRKTVAEQIAVRLDLRSGEEAQTSSVWDGNEAAAYAEAADIAREVGRGHAA